MSKATIRSAQPGDRVRVAAVVETVMGDEALISMPDGSVMVPVDDLQVAEPANPDSEFTERPPSWLFMETLRDLYRQAFWSGYYSGLGRQFVTSEQLDEQFDRAIRPDDSTVRMLREEA